MTEWKNAHVSLSRRGAQPQAVPLLKVLQLDRIAFYRPPDPDRLASSQIGSVIWLGRGPTHVELAPG